MIVVAGAHGQVARLLTQQLAAAGEAVRGLVRNPAHAGDVRADGADAVVCDLETASHEDVAAAIRGADAVVFAAGAGPGSGAARKWTVDRDGAVKLLRAAEAEGVGRYVMVSSVGAEDPPPGDDVFSVYLRAKAEADAVLQVSALAWTIVRPGPLTDGPPTDHVRLVREPERAEITRADTAALLAAVLAEPGTARLVLYAMNGGDTVEDAVRRATAGPRN